ncbi:MAG: Lrp/AsnC family transcriptional regulator [Clostridia bacterium]|nr:Lrp/AsnC family transcriptional regulator [Clostridia bacterium]
MDNTDKKILQIIQHDFPLVNRPYKAIGEKLDLSEEEVLDRIIKLKNEKIIRRIGGLFSSKKLGYTSLLCAAKVKEEDTDKVAGILNSYPGITHNYKRDNEYNIWFTLISDSEETRDKTISEIESKIGYFVNKLPATKLFKLRAVFKIPEGDE